MLRTNAPTMPTRNSEVRADPVCSAVLCCGRRQPCTHMAVRDYCSAATPAAAPAAAVATAAAAQQISDPSVEAVAMTWAAAGYAQNDISVGPLSSSASH